MNISLNQTVEHLKSLMASVKDVVFPDYSEVRTENALANISARIEAVSPSGTADAFMERLPAIKDLLATDVEAIALNDPLPPMRRKSSSATRRSRQCFITVPPTNCTGSVSRSSHVC